MIFKSLGTKPAILLAIVYFSVQFILNLFLSLQTSITAMQLYLSAVFPMTQANAISKLVLIA